MLIFVAALCLQAQSGLDQKVVERVNSFRKIASLDPVTADPVLSKGCKAHAAYLVKNESAPSVQGLGAHDEDSKLPGYSDDGAKAAGASDIAYVNPVEAVDGWMATLFHRIPVLTPGLKKIGIGYAKGGKWGWVSVMDVVSGQANKGKDTTVIYPVDKQADVPFEFGGEEPSPIPENSEKKAGYPITATFPTDAKVTDVKALLTAGEETQIDFWLSTPEQPADERYQRNTICLIPKLPLMRRSTHIVSITAIVNGKKWSKTWTFSTGSR